LCRLREHRDDRSTAHLQRRYNRENLILLPGLERNLYPDGSKFQPDDIRSPNFIKSALHELNVNLNPADQSLLRAAVTIEAVVPPEVVKDRDRLRALGHPVPIFTPDEYWITLSLPRSFPLNSRERELLLNKLAAACRENFQRTYSALPESFGNAFKMLERADFFEYELVLREEIQNVEEFLQNLLNAYDGETAKQRKAAPMISTSARTFRSPSTQYSFSDLVMQTRLFVQVQLNEALSILFSTKFTANRALTLSKMDFLIDSLANEARRAGEADKITGDLLARSQARSQDYVLAIKADAQRPANTVIDQNVLDALLANDSYNFLVRRALESGLKAKHAEQQLRELQEQRKQLESDNTNAPQDATSKYLQTEAIERLRGNYDRLISNIKNTYYDFTSQQFADAVRLTMQARTSSGVMQIAINTATGFAIGTAIGIGFSLLGLYVRNSNRT
jgi:hypothetical protein